MSCPDAKTWDLLSMNLFDADRAETLRQHSEECDQCFAARQEASRRHTELLDALRAFDRDHDRRRDQLMAMLPQSVAVPQKERNIELWPWWLREGGFAMILQRYKTRWAAVAVLPVACLLLMLFLMTGEKIAFADVLQSMRQARTMICDIVTTTTVVEGQLPDLLAKPVRSTMSMYLDGETRAVLYVQELGALSVTAVIGDAQPGDPAAASSDGPREAEMKEIRSLALGDKIYVWAGDQVHIVSSGDRQQNSGAEWLGRLLDVRESPDRNLGEQIIDGRRAVGFEIAGWKLGIGTRPTKGSPTPSDSDSQLRVWVDVEQNLPIRLEIDQKMVMPDATATIHQQWDNIRWNVALDPNDFRPPSQEEIAKGVTTQVPSIDETAFVDGMRKWLELKDQAQAGIDLMQKKAREKGEELPAMISSLFERAAMESGYPERLDTSWLLGTFSARATLAALAKRLPALEPIPTELDEKEAEKLRSAQAKETAMATAQHTIEVVTKANIIAAFYQKLANEQRDPEYFGVTVEPGDSAAILLQWRLDDGRYRVIHGDLESSTVASLE